jgi:Tol biopolymer transport system component
VLYLGVLCVLMVSCGPIGIISEQETAPQRLSETLFIALSGDQTTLLAAHEGKSELEILYQLPLPFRVQITWSSWHFPIVSRDGTWVTVVDDEQFNTSVYRVSLLGSDEPIVILNWSGTQFEASVSRDGKRVAFLATENECTGCRHGEDWYCPKHVYVMDSDGGNIQRITTNTAQRCFLSWSPNNTQIAYREVCDPASSEVPKVYMVTLAPNNTLKHITQVTANGIVPAGEASAWSPDGEWLQWSSYRGGGITEESWISRFDPGGKVVEEVSLNQVVWDSGAWSPDSRRLAWITWDDVLTVWNIEDGKTSKIQLQEVTRSGPMKWLSDGEHLAFAGYRIDAEGNTVGNRQWFMVNIDGTGLVEFK